MAVVTTSTKKPSNKNLLTKACKNSSENKLKPKNSIYTPLLKWYDNFGRHDLPWKLAHSAYHVWLSEIMLQQTQVTTVIPYFYRFIETFPTISSLAQADSNQVLALWSGLGYYARARNLHRTAQIIHSTFSGQFPKTLEELISLPGIGRSTAGAMLAQSFNLFGVILDGNVKRILTRYLTLKPTTTQTAKQFEHLLWDHAEHFTPKLPQNPRVGDYTQAIMDLGATICTRTQPKCIVCPLNKTCEANRTQTQALYPIKKIKKINPIKTVTWLVCLFQPNQFSPSQVLLSQQPINGIWGGLWSFPELSLDDFSSTNKINNLIHLLKQDKLLDIAKHKKQITLSSLSMGVHIFTHFKLEYKAMLLTLTGTCPTILEKKQAQWYNPIEITQIGLPSPITKILNQTGFFNNHDNEYAPKSLLP